MAERDCTNCIHRVPVLDEYGHCKYAECDSWNCEFVDRQEALQAWRDKKLYEEHIDQMIEDLAKEHGELGTGCSKCLAKYTCVDAFQAHSHKCGAYPKEEE